MRNWFTFAGMDSRDFGIYISGQGTYNAPEKMYNMIEIPGRSGNLVGIENRLANIELTYPAFIYDSFKQQIANMKSAFLALNGYQRLSDTYNPEEYRLAVFHGGTEVNATVMNDAGQFELTFDCKPQRYLLSGEREVDITDSLQIVNPTAFASKPLIRVYGYGTLGINSDSITIADEFAYVDIDCEMMDCFSGVQNANPYISFSSNNFPTLKAGENNFSKTANITQILVIPRWWQV